MKKNCPLKYLLIPFSWIFGSVVFLRNLLFDFHILPVKQYSIPVISVGNITVGGTGKTPMVEYLVELLKDEFRLATLSRGYRRKSSGFVLADNNPSTSQVGDEPCQIKNKFPGIEVAVDAKRTQGILELIKTVDNLDLVILDDAFQHRYVKPGLSILLFDFNQHPGNDHLLPFGRMREPISSIKRADIIIITKTPPNMDTAVRDSWIRFLTRHHHQHLFFSYLKYESIKKVFREISDHRKVKTLDPGIHVLLVCGIAVPGILKDYISGMTSKITDLFYPDHHHYRKKDIEYIQTVFNRIRSPEKLILTTEKDSVRFKQFEGIPEEIKKNLFYIPLKMAFHYHEEEEFNHLIFQYVRKNKRNRVVHPG